MLLKSWQKLPIYSTFAEPMYEASKDKKTFREQKGSRRVIHLMQKKKTVDGRQLKRYHNLNGHKTQLAITSTQNMSN